MEWPLRVKRVRKAWSKGALPGQKNTAAARPQPCAAALFQVRPGLFQEVVSWSGSLFTVGVESDWLPTWQLGLIQVETPIRGKITA